MRNNPYSKIGAAVRGFSSAFRVIFGIGMFSACMMLGWAQTITFTYQGLLKDGSNAANGPYDLCFTLYNALEAGSVVGGDDIS